MMRPRIRDSLFLRLLLLQLVLLAGLAAATVTLYVIERNRSVTLLLADHWAPAIAHELGRAPSGTALPRVVRRAAPPAGAVGVPLDSPRAGLLRAALAAHGVELDGLAVVPGERPQVTWLHVPGSESWMGLQGPLFEAGAPGRLALLLGLVLVLLVACSWWGARQLTRPLERLRTRILSGARADPAQGDPPEVAEIGAAHDELLARLERQQRERALLLAGVSHDLRSPLARIRMAAELLPEVPEVGPRRASIVANVHTADRLVESFLDLVRTGELPLGERVDLTEVARSVASAAGWPEPQATPLWLDDANRQLLERALFNLADNARHHGRPPFGLQVRAEGSEAVFEVFDGGPGISREEQESLLRAFARGDGSRNRPGSGLGLAVVQETAERLRGRVVFDGSAQRFAVQLRLPRAP